MPSRHQEHKHNRPFLQDEAKLSAQSRGTRGETLSPQVMTTAALYYGQSGPGSLIKPSPIWTGSFQSMEKLDDACPGPPKSRSKNVLTLTLKISVLLIRLPNLYSLGT